MMFRMFGIPARYVVGYVAPEGLFSMQSDGSYEATLEDDNAHAWTEKQVKAGVFAADIAKNFYKYYVDNGYEKNFVYGPLHGTGIIEVEAPWCETSSDYYLKPNMCYQVDTYISADTFGVRWEKGVAVKDGGYELLSPEIPLVCPEILF